MTFYMVPRRGSDKHTKNDASVGLRKYAEEKPRKGTFPLSIGRNVPALPNLAVPYTIV